MGVFRHLCLGLVLVCVVVSASVPARAAEQTCGLFTYDTSAHDGYTLYSPLRSNQTFLIDMYGNEVHRWVDDYPPGNSVYLLENGNLLRTSRPTNGGGGVIREIAWDGTVIWDYTYFNDDHRQHHDVEPLPNGNVLILAWEFLPKSEAIAAGRDSTTMDDEELWPEQVVEVRPILPDSGEIVWEWRAWDHLIQDFDSTKPNYGVVAEHPELINLNYYLTFNDDWLHANAVDYNQELDQIIISIRTFSEFWVIDHSTTTAEAAGHTGGNSGMGGDILYRWGNPEAYDAGTPTNQQLYLQHDAQWIPEGSPGEGNILVFNNGGQSRLYSTIDELVSTVDGTGSYPQPLAGEAHGPASPTWTYVADPPESFFSSFISGATRQPNGNTLICQGAGGRLFEVTVAGDIVWEYVNPVGNAGPCAQGEAPAQSNVFRCYRYAADYPGLAGQDLSPQSSLELYPATISGLSWSPVEPTSGQTLSFSATVFSDSAIVGVDLFADTGAGFFSTPMSDDGSHADGSAGDSLYGAQLTAPASGVVEAYLLVTSGTADTSVSPANPPATAYRIVVEPTFVCGDVDGSLGSPNIVDLTYLVAYLFSGGPPPVVLESADVNGGDGLVNIVDLTYMVAYLFAEGPPPSCS